MTIYYMPQEPKSFTRILKKILETLCKCKLITDAHEAD